MYLGKCRIRSAGRTSGSIEITLPPALQTFTGLGCRVVVRDGLQPEIVLQPDFAEARLLLEALWRRLSLALCPGELVSEIKPSAFIFTLLPPRHWQRSLPVAYADIVALMQSGEERAARDPEALARIVSVLAEAIGRSLGLRPPLAFGFGGAVAYAVTEVPAGFSSDFERSMTAGLCRQAQLSQRPPVPPLKEEFWLECEPALRRIYEQFRAWQNSPGEYEAARQQWYRAFQCESIPGCAETRAPTHAP
ncbi:MAG: hypothetical protein F9K29_10760 [Hyphomicrobiaceae bacterium]|nr:MAG: hypothetical protein F9K29_10760 [Hyphomicrobiaceae bacterium]